MSFVCDCLGISEAGRLTIGGADVTGLAKKYGTPLFLMDEDAIRAACRDLHAALKAHYAGLFRVAYASKALSCKYIYRLMNQEGMSADVASGGELYTALSAGFPAERIVFHGNNKTRRELELGLSARVGLFVVDNREELHTLNELAAQAGITPDIALRLTPGVEAHTHEFIQTGKIDSKFGFTMENGQAEAALAEAFALPHIHPVGIHCHIGSQIFEADPFAHTVGLMMGFMARVKEKYGRTLLELNLGGGFGIRYIDSHEPRSLDEVVRLTAGAVTEQAEKLGLPLPRLVLEPGRLIVGPNGITVYTVGAVKEIPGVRTYVSVDGGMTDNPRFALYGAVYEALLPERPQAVCDRTVTIAGRCCESGDLVAKDIRLPEVKAGDLLAVLATGAYNYSMASNYNRLPRPPVVMVSQGAARVAVRRESYEDLIALDE
jgi:diaminopimelate decarboxylase